MSERLSQRPALWRRPKTAVFAAIAVMTGYVLWHNERFLIEPANPVWEHYAQLAWWLIPHGIAGACALLLAPLQFSERLRKRYTTAHHVVGRIYVVGALILAPLGAIIQYLDQGMGSSRAFTLLAAVDAALLMTTTSVAFLFAIRRRIAQHRQWMTRSYAVALVFFEGRFLSGVFGMDNSETASMAIIWSCLALALLFAELANSFYDIRGAVVSPLRQPAARQPSPVYSLDTSAT